MKRYMIVPLVLLSLSFTCHREPPAQQTTKEVKTVPNWSEQLEAVGLQADQMQHVDVLFIGPVLHVTEPPAKRRAVIPRDRQGLHPHRAYLTVDAASVNVAKFEGAFPNACNGTVCNAELLDGIGLRVVGLAGPSN